MDNSERITPSQLELKLALLGLSKRREAAEFLGIGVNELGKWLAGKKEKGIPFGVWDELTAASDDAEFATEIFEKLWDCSLVPIIPFFLGGKDAKQYLVVQGRIDPDEFEGYPDGWWQLAQLRARDRVIRRGAL